MPQSPGQADNDNKLSAAQVAAFAKAAGFSGDDLVTAVAIVKAESNNNSAAKGGPNRNGSYDWGLFQINDVHKPTDEVKKNPLANARVAYGLYTARGNFKDWATYNSGSYQEHLPAARAGVKLMNERGVKWQQDTVASAGKIADAPTGGIGVPDALNVPAAITSGISALTSTFSKLFLSAGAYVFAAILLVLGIIILLRQPAGKLVGRATPVGKVAKIARVAD
jgi:hypothetical protein